MTPAEDTAHLAGDDVTLLHPPGPPPVPEPHRCVSGWLVPPSEPHRGPPAPCPVCRPWLAEDPPRPPTRAELDALRERAGRPGGRGSRATTWRRT